jgi:hypothetical protein
LSRLKMPRLVSLKTMEDPDTCSQLNVSTIQILYPCEPRSIFSEYSRPCRPGDEGCRIAAVNIFIFREHSGHSEKTNESGVYRRTIKIEPPNDGNRQSQ